MFPGPSSPSSLFVLSCGRFPVLFVAFFAGFRFGLVWVKIFTCESPVSIFGNEWAWVVRGVRGRVVVW